MKDSIISSNKELIEDRKNVSMRPNSLKNFIGQKNTLHNLKIFIDAACVRHEPLDHVLLYGPPGLGKTTLAQIISKELNVKFHSTSGPLLTKVGDLATIITNLDSKDILFIDEIHRLNRNVEEVLYQAMEDYCLDIIIGEGYTAKTLKIDLPKFTLIGATTRLGLLSNPLIDRFGIPLHLEFYSLEELIKVIENGAKIISSKISYDGAREIASRSRGTPRIALRLLRRIRDFTQVLNYEVINQEVANRTLISLGIDALGLNRLDINYLKFLYNSSNPVGIETISAALSEDASNIEETVEPYLIKINFIQKTPRGRILTSQAITYLL